MGVLLVIVGVLLAVAGFAAGLFVAVQAFRDEWWKGVLCVISPWYFQRYAENDFQHDHEETIRFVWKFGYLVGVLLIFAGSWLTHPFR